MSPQLPFDTLYSIFSLLPMRGLLYREDRRLYDLVGSLGLPVPHTNTKDLASCASVCRAWNTSAQRILLRDIRVVNHAQCAYLVNLTSDSTIGCSIRALEFINGTRRPHSRTLRADITHGDVVALVKNCPRLRTLTLFGCPMFDENLEELVRDASLTEIITLGLSRQACAFTLEVTRRFLDSMPRLRAFGCPRLSCNSEHLPPVPITKLYVLVTYQDSRYSFWLLRSSVDTLIAFDPELHTQQSLGGVKAALELGGRSIQRLRVPSAAYVSELLPLCPNLRHLEFPVLEMNFEPLLGCIATQLESLTLSSNRYIGRKAKATLSAPDVRILINAVEKNPKLRTLKVLDLSLTYHNDAYPRTPAAEFAILKALCERKGIRFPCPDVSRLISGPRGVNPILSVDAQYVFAVSEFSIATEIALSREDSWT